MKIVHIISSLDRGGAENHLVTLACEQKKIGYDVVVIYLSGNNYWRPFLKKRKIKVIETRIQNKYSLIDLLRSIFVLKKQFSILKPDLVHLHLSLPELMIIIYRIFFFKSFKSFKLVITKHLDSFILEGTYGQHKLIRGIFLEKILFKISDHVIFISKQVKKYFKKEIFFQEKKNSIIYYGVDSVVKIDNKKVTKLRKNLKDNKNQKIILCIARHSPQKKINFLLKGYQLFYKKNNNSKLIIVGKGKLSDELKKYAFKLNITRKVKWISFTDNIHELLKITDVFCLTSDYEGLGLVLLEALQMKVPIITINKSAMKEVVKDNYNGILLDNNSNHNKLCEKLLILTQNKKLRSRIKRNIPKSLNKFNKKVMLFKTLKIYEK